MIRLFDTIHGEVRELQLRDAGKVSMYVCGPTVYDLPHLGHGRFTLVWDVALRRAGFEREPAKGDPHIVPGKAGNHGAPLRPEHIKRLNSAKAGKRRQRRDEQQENSIQRAFE